MISERVAESTRERNSSIEGERERERERERRRERTHRRRRLGLALAKGAARTLEGNLGSFAEGCILIPGASAVARSPRTLPLLTHLL